MTSYQYISSSKTSLFSFLLLKWQKEEFSLRNMTNPSNVCLSAAAEATDRAFVFFLLSTDGGITFLALKKSNLSRKMETNLI